MKITSFCRDVTINFVVNERLFLMLEINLILIQKNFNFRTLGSLVKSFERKFLFRSKLSYFYEKMICTFATKGSILLFQKYKYFSERFTDCLREKYIILQGRDFNFSVNGRVLLKRKMNLILNLNEFNFRTLGCPVKFFKRKFLFGTKLSEFHEKMIYTFVANGCLLLLPKYKYF